MSIDFTRRTSIGSFLVLLIVCLQHGLVIGQERTRQTSLISPAFGVGPDQRATFTLFLSAGEPVRAKVTLHDDRGRIVAESSEAEVRAGAFHSFQFNPGDIHMAAEDGTGRRQVRASCWIRVSQPWGTVGELDAALEIATVSTGVTDGTSNTFMIGEKYVRPLHGIGASGLTSRVAKDMLVGIAAGQRLRITAFNADAADSGAGRSEPIAMQANIYDEDGNVVATTRGVAIPTGQFGSVDVARGDLAMSGEPGTGRAQVRAKPLFAFPNAWHGRIALSFEIVDAAGHTVEGPQCLVFFLGGAPHH